jgi:hypothetical protein
MNTRVPRTVFCAGLAAAAVAGCFSSSDDGRPAETAVDAGALSDAVGHVDGTSSSDGGSGDGSARRGDAGLDAAPNTDGGCTGGGESGTFTCTGSLAVARDAPGGAVLPNGNVLVAGGWNSASQTLLSAEVYDPVSGAFTATGTMGSAHLWAGWTAPWPVLPSGEVLAAGGLDASGALLATAELYDPAAGTFSPTGALGTAVIAFDLVSLQNGSVLLIGGYSSVTGAPPTP